MKKLLKLKRTKEDWPVLTHMVDFLTFKEETSPKKFRMEKYEAKLASVQATCASIRRS